MFLIMKDQDPQTSATQALFPCWCWSTAQGREVLLLASKSNPAPHWKSGQQRRFVSSTAAPNLIHLLRLHFGTQHLRFSSNTLLAVHLRGMLWNIQTWVTSHVTLNWTHRCKFSLQPVHGMDAYIVDPVYRWAAGGWCSTEQASCSCWEQSASSQLCSLHCQIRSLEECSARCLVSHSHR